MQFLRFNFRLPATVLILMSGALCCAIPVVISGCTMPTAPLGLSAAPVENPLFVPAVDSDFLWNQLTDSIDDYFRIRSEQRVRMFEGVLSEGGIITYPKVSGTYFEPWRNDTAPGFDRLHSTLQTIQRRCEVRVIPTQGGYLIDLAVYKELEDRLQPSDATVGRSVVRNDNSLEQDDERIEAPSAPRLGQIPLGRDPYLEQKILADIAARVIDPAGLVPAAPAQQPTTGLPQQAIPSQEVIGQPTPATTIYPLP